MKSEPGKEIQESGSMEDPIARTASAWLMREDEGLTQAERDELERWLKTDPRHRQMHEELKVLWKIMDRMEELPTTAPRPMLRAGWHRSVLPASVLAAAAALVFGVIAWWWPQQSGRFETVAFTDSGGWRQMELPDGSIIRLNAESVVSVAYTQGVRRVKLERGQAFFSVAKDVARPFLVRAGNIDVQAVGTAFDVRLHSGEVDVLVTEGRVQVSDANKDGAPSPKSNSDTAALTIGKPDMDAASNLVVAGQRAIITQPVVEETKSLVTVTLVSAEEAERATAWQDRRISFEEATLNELVATFNRHNLHQLIITDPRLAERRFGGTFPAGDYATLVRLLEQNFGVLVERKQDETRLRLP